MEWNFLQLIILRVSVLLRGKHVTNISDWLLLEWNHNKLCSTLLPLYFPQRNIFKIVTTAFYRGEWHRWRNWWEETELNEQNKYSFKNKCTCGIMLIQIFTTSQWVCLHDHNNPIIISFLECIDLSTAHLCDYSQWLDYYDHINGSVLVNLISSSKCLVWVIIQWKVVAASLKGQVFLEAVAAGNSQAHCTRTVCPRCEQHFIPEHCASSHLSSVTVIPPNQQSDSGDSKICFFKSRALVQFSLLLKQICKQLRKDRNTASRKKNIQSFPFPEHCISFVFTPLQCKKIIQGEKNNK